MFISKWSRLLWLFLLLSSLALGFWLWATKQTSTYRGTTGGPILYYVNTKKKAIALTFDDGPNPLYTEQILRLLRIYQAKATFFVLGKELIKHPRIGQKILQQGSEIGNHGYRHLNLRAVNTQTAIQDMQKGSATIEKITGQLAKFFRPPFGNYTPKVLAAAIGSGETLTLWTMNKDTRDWANPGVSTIASIALHQTKPGDILLFHDGGGNRLQTIEALALILPRLKAEGYQMVTLSHLERLGQHVHPHPLPVRT